jgi:hypothetical protein
MARAGEEARIDVFEHSSRSLDSPATATTSTASPSWFVQILFGRYRSLGNIQWTHLAVLGCIGFIMVRTPASAQRDHVLSPVSHSTHLQ